MIDFKIFCLHKFYSTIFLLKKGNMACIYRVKVSVKEENWSYYLGINNSLK